MSTPAVEFIEKEAYEKGFSSHFKDKIQPSLADTEAFRLAQYSKLKKRMMIAVPAAPLLLVLGVVLEANIGGEDAFFIKVALFLIVIVFGWAYAPALKYSQELKQKLLPVVCDFFGGMTYSLTGDSLVESQYSGQIFPVFSTRASEDFISGAHLGVSIQLHESTLSRRQNKSTVTVFQGLILELGFPREFQGKTILLKDGGMLGNFFTGSDFKGLAHVQLEDPEFEKIFQVFGSDQVEARFLLTTAFMERLLNLARLRGSRGSAVQCVFEHSKLVIAIPSHQNLFEPKGIRQSALDVEDLHVFLAQMNEVFELIKVLNLKK